MTTAPDLEPSASVGIHAAIAAYAQALDTGRVDDLVELFTPDGVSEIAGMATFEGHDQLRAGYANFVPEQPQLHLAGNTVITSWSADEARAVSNLAFFQRDESGWAVRLVGRYDDTFRLYKGSWRFQRRITSFLP